MKLGEQWEIEMPGFGKMTVSTQTNTQTNKQTGRQTKGHFTNRYKHTNKQTNKWSVLKEMQTNGQVQNKHKPEQTNKAIPRLTWSQFNLGL